MATACPHAIMHPQDTRRTSRLSEDGAQAARAAAEARWRAVVDAQRADLDLLRDRWPDRASPESAAAIDRLRAVVAPGGEADRVVEALRDAYGGPDRVPPAVSRWLEAYARYGLTFGPDRPAPPPWPEPDATGDLDAPTIRRKALRQIRRAGGAKD